MIIPDDDPFALLPPPPPPQPVHFNGQQFLNLPPDIAQRIQNLPADQPQVRGRGRGRGHDHGHIPPVSFFKIINLIKYSNILNSPPNYIMFQILPDVSLLCHLYNLLDKDGFLRYVFLRWGI